MYVSEDVSVVLSLGGDPPPVVLQLPESGGVHGRVIMPPGDADRGVYVHLMSLKGDALPDIETLVERGRTDWAERGTAFEAPQGLTAIPGKGAEARVGGRHGRRGAGGRRVRSDSCSSGRPAASAPRSGRPSPSRMAR